MPSAPVTVQNVRSQIGSDQARIDATEQQRRLSRNFTERSLPQLKSGIAARGQFFSGARQRAEKEAGETFLEGSFDIQSALQRQLDDFTRQRIFTALGVLI